MSERETNERGEQTVRLLNPGKFGLVGLETLESLRLTASEGLDTNSWGAGVDMILWDIGWQSELYRAWA